MNSHRSVAAALWRRRQLLTAVSAIGLSLGVAIAATAVAGEEPNVVNQQSQTNGEHRTRPGNNRIKYDSRQHKLTSHQHKEPSEHMLNPQPLPPG